MRARLILIIVAFVLLAGFAALNWSEFARTAPLSFGGAISEMPLGLLMLSLLLATLIVFLVSSMMQETRHLMDRGRNAKTLDAQRDLADRAEASRFTELRTQLETHLRENHRREEIAATELSKSMVQTQRELRTQLETISQTLSTQLREFETRIDSRIERLQGVTDVTPRPLDLPLRDRVKL